MRKIIHCDADCFFAAIELRDDPSLVGRPVAVGGSSSGRGVISTCNYEARRFGVRSAMASAHALKLCPGLLILPHRMDVYREVSVQMRRIFHAYSDRVEPLSLDEAYLDVSDSSLCRGSATLIAQQIRQQVHTQLGITVSAGIAPNKFLAKVASDWRKPNGLTVVTPAQVASFVRQLPVRRIHGVGQATAARLASLGVTTCADLQRLSVFNLCEHFGAMGRRLYDLARGVDEREVSGGRRRKSLSVEHTWPRDLPNLTACLACLPGLVTQLQKRLMALDDGYRVIKLQVKVKFSDFTQTTLERAHDQLDSPLWETLVREAYARHQGGVRLLGVGVRFLDLSEDRAFHQLTLFD